MSAPAPSFASLAEEVARLRAENVRLLSDNTALRPLAEMELARRRLCDLFISALICTAQNGYAREVDPFVGLCRETWGEEALFDALKDLPHGKVRLRSAEEAVAAGLPEFDPYGKGLTRLMYAAQKGDEARVEWLLKRGAQLELADSGGSTALLKATNCNHVGVVRLLLSKGASTEVSEVEKGFMSPLHAACHYGYAEVVRALLENGASIDASASIKGLSVKPLLLACIAATSKAGYNIDTIRVLLEMGADTEAASILSPTKSYPFRPLDVACSKGHVEVVTVLLRSSALVTLKNIKVFASSASASDSGAYSVLLELLSRIPAGSGAARAAVFAALAGR